ncbi:AFG1-like ATPase-domain-containing protein [Tribonema minus]|uniref:AFG1-like ATPase-domain-containing protein n=1 Tax=Tribonema minus TaxID=303371 RepID=A0A835Z6K0_9STRA|nr:AFG1-like ATPase-domain-containing protein [Tribonema minus]
MEEAAEAAAKAEAEARNAAKKAALEARKSNSAQPGAAELATASYDDADAEEPPKAKYSPAPKGLFIWGEVGSGKSLGMDLFFATAQVQARRVHFQPFMLEVHQRIHNFKQRQLSVDKAQREEREQQQLLRRQRRQHVQPFGRRQLQQPHHAPIFHIDLVPERDAIRQVALELSREAALLCFDEFQVTDIADALILSKLFRVLWERRVVVVATSNRPPQDLYLGGLNRHDFLPFIRELQQHCVVFCMDSQTGQTFHTVMVSDVPTLSTEKHNQARRLIWLIDELYESKTRLICSSEVPCTQLFQAPQEVFAHEDQQSPPERTSTDKPGPTSTDKTQPSNRAIAPADAAQSLVVREGELASVKAGAGQAQQPPLQRGVLHGGKTPRAPRSPSSPGPFANAHGHALDGRIMPDLAPVTTGSATTAPSPLSLLHRAPPLLLGVALRNPGRPAFCIV